MVRYVLFDLDNTLYPKSSGLDREVGRRMTEFTAGYLGVTREEAQALRETQAIPYGTTLKWLCGCHGLGDPEEFLRAVHPENVEAYIRPNPRLGAMLRAMNQPKAILTNAPREHALRVLRCLGILEELPRIFDLRYNGFQGKPACGTYTKLIRETGADIREVLFIDDMPRYLLPFRDLGGQVLLVDEEGRHRDVGLPSIREITELGGYMEKFL
jgi:putative hydrolase of the HAD superfamily